MHQGKAFIFCAPSGSGKTTIVQHLLSTNPHLGFSISACTRPKRAIMEEHGKHYYFYSPQEFKEIIANDGFIEWEEVYENNFYGTLKSEVERIWAEGRHVVFDVDVKGGINLKKYFGDKALAVFVKVPSVDELEKRLRYRNTDSEESIQRRVAKAQFEMSFEKEFDVTLVNENLDDSLAKAQQLVDDFLKK